MNRHLDTARGKSPSMPSAEVPQNATLGELLAEMRKTNRLLEEIRELDAIRTRVQNGHFRLESDTDTSTRLVQPGQRLSLTEAEGPFGGTIVFASVAFSTLNADIEAVLDGNLHIFPVDQLVQGRFDLATNPGLVITRYTPTEAPAVVVALNPGGASGQPFLHQLHIRILNKHTSAMSVYSNFSRIRLYTE